jgi:hypothetical protein
VIHKTNKYDLSGEYGIGYTTNTNKEFYFDLEDYDKIKDYCWIEDIGTTGYRSIRARVPGKNKKVIMHWVIMEEKWYDHIDRNPFNNRKNNLRKATKSENNRNCSISKNNISGIIGVSLDKRNNNWRARITVNRKEIALGSFKDKKDAIRVRLKAEKKYFGDFAPQRHLFEEYGITTQN